MCQQQQKRPLPDVDAAVRAIAHPLRREILKWLKAPLLYFPSQERDVDRGICVGQITQRSGLSQSTVSQHLAVLKQAALVEVCRTGPFHFYRRNEAAVAALAYSLRDQLQNELGHPSQLPAP
ncbi:helix-turn-helix transcriptional regulator [Pseudomonas lurida]|jgi:ArsR family transcriptional regulator|nr:metalloregulator ArsR/SmtB family transcription factor [Pseudomonas lurida]MBC3239353.1 helix-turn-helix transcriptional regulator [Pseudomonas lurida]